MKYFIIAGERSGDLHASSLIKQLLSQSPESEVYAWGGDMMQQAGAKLLQHYESISFMGLWEVMVNLRTISSKMKLCKKQIAKLVPDMVILVDFPGFNLRIAKFSKSIGLTTCYYISPKIWAWKKGRIKQIKKYVDQMLVILPFEKKFYANLGYDVTYVGNPLVERIEQYPFDEEFIKNSGGRPNIAFLPGSRKQELLRSISVITYLAQRKPDYHFLVAGVDNLPTELYQPLEGLGNVSVHFNKTYDVLKRADAAVVTSGTATLEAALIGTKQVVVYKTSGFTYFFGRLLVKIKFISLVNLIAGRAVVKELIQDQYNVNNVLKELEDLLGNTDRIEAISNDYREIRTLIGDLKTSEIAASEIVRATR